jgi:alpha/beta superfamily hydrolase
LTPKSTERATIDGPAGALEIAQNIPPSTPRGIALVAHPHPLQGGTLDNKVAQTLAKTFFALDYAAIRVNYRGVGLSEGTFDDGPGEAADALAALRFAQDRLDAERALPVVLAGFSFGAYVQTIVAQTVAAERLVFVGPAVRRFAAAVPAGHHRHPRRGRRRRAAL